MPLFRMLIQPNNDEATKNIMENQLSSPTALVTMFLMLFLTDSCFSADTYKYIGKNGEVVYSQTPPKDGAAERILLKSNRPPSQSRPSAVDILEVFTRDSEEKQLDAQKKADAEKQASIKKQNCEAAKRNLALYEGSPNKLVRDGSGNYQRLTDTEHQKRIETARKNVAEFCN